MRKAIATGLVAVLIVVGLFLGASTTSDYLNGSTSCAPATTLLDSELQNASDETDRYIAINVAPLFRHPDTLDWFVRDAKEPKPALINATIEVGDGADDFGFFSGDVRVYNITLERSCAGGEWEVTKLVLAKGQKAPPLAGNADQADPKQTQ